MTRVLVTGGRGFLGRAVAVELRRRRRRVFSAGRADADLLDRAAVRRLIAHVKPSVVVHAAGTTKAPDWRGYWDDHVSCAVNLLDALPPGTRVVVAGSAAEYGPASGRRPAREDGPCEPLGPYGASKLAETLAALSYRHRGLDVAVARVFNLTGPGCPAHLIPGAFAGQLAVGASTLDVGDLSPWRDFIDARDAARALAELTDPHIPGGIYNVCSGRPTRIGAVLETLIRLSGRQVAVRRDRRRARRVDLPFIVGDGARLRRATGWRPRVSLEQSLADSLESFRR